jgi:tRNA 2-thiocytidine biosynthesis protein TtcA
LNLFFHGEISTMLPSQTLFNGKFHLIRPLALCEEKFIIQYASASDFPRLDNRCPNSDNTKRMLMKNILNMLSEFNRDIKTNIFRSMKRIKPDYIIK